MLGSLWTRLMAFGALALGVLLAILRMQGQAKQAGRDEVVAKDAQAEADALKRMQDAAAKAPQSDQEVIDRLKDGKL